MIREVTATDNDLLFNSRRSMMFFWLIVIVLVFLTSVARINAQRVYGVAARRTTVVVNSGSTTVARRTTVVAGSARPALLPAGYISVLPAGYRVISGGYYIAGGVRYRAQFYQGRTVYIRI